MLRELCPALSRGENERILEQLETMAQAGTLPHGILIEGDSAQECMQLADALARVKMCDCEKPLSGECASCRIFASGSVHPDVLYIEGEGKTGAIPVENIRRMRLEAQNTPTKGGCRVFILPDCDTMNDSAQNAFLKLLEEPPEGAVFIMTCRQRMNMLETIRSRATAVHIEGGKREEEISDALRETADAFAAALCEPSEWEAVRLTSYFVRDRKENAAAQKELLQFTGLLRGIIRDAVVISAGAQDMLRSVSTGAKRLSSVSAEKLYAMLSMLDDIDRAVKLYVPLPLVTTDMVSRLRGILRKR